MEAFTPPLLATLLLSFRISPTFAFAPPFTLLRTPASVRVLLGFALSFWLVLANPATTSARVDAGGFTVTALFLELLLGITLAFSLQMAFAALLTAGRAIDIQAGFGLAQLADPTLRTQMPLVGTLFSYAAAAIFFATDGPHDLLAIWSMSVTYIPLGAFSQSVNLDALITYISSVFVLALGLAGLVLLVLFLVDMTIALMSRTLPQMNMLVLGFQVKTIALLLTLPFAFAFSGALFLRLVRLAVTSTPQLL
jgi:flagellar biosynthesis protein FliR